MNYTEYLKKLYTLKKKANHNNTTLYSMNPNIMLTKQTAAKHHSCLYLNHGVYG